MTRKDAQTDGQIYDQQENEDLENMRIISPIRVIPPPIRIQDAWNRVVQEVARQYNEGLETNNMAQIMNAIRRTVEIYTNKETPELQDQSKQLMGLIAKWNIECINPALDHFMAVLEGQDTEQRIDAIKFVGEICSQRPGWSYFGIEMLVKIA
jgi:hypothetical protein